MATAQTGRTFLLPKRKLQVTVVSSQGQDFPGSEDMLDAVAIAAYEGYEGFGVWYGELKTPPVFGRLEREGEGVGEDEASPAVKSIRHVQRERTTQFFLAALIAAEYENIVTAFLPFISATGTHLDALVAEWLVEALVMLDNTNVLPSVEQALRRLVVVGEAAVVAGVLTHLAAQLEDVRKEPPVPVKAKKGGILQSVCSFFKGKKRSGEKVKAVQPSDARPFLPLHHATPHSSSSSSSQSQLTAGESIGGSSNSNNNSSSSSSSNNNVSKKSSKTGDGACILRWLNPLTYENVGQWTATGRQSRDDACRRNRGSVSALSGGPQAEASGAGAEARAGAGAGAGTGALVGPAVAALAQYFFLHNAQGQMYAAYFSRREVDGGVDCGVTSCIRRCYHSQTVSGGRSASLLENYVVDVAAVSLQEVVDRSKKRDRTTAAGTTTPQPGTSGSDGRSSASATTGDGGGKAEAQAAAGVQTTTTTLEGGEGKGSSMDSGGVDYDNRCAVCLGALQRPTRFRKCGHVFCRQCLERSFQERTRCPLCQQVIAVTAGNMPDGLMALYGSPHRLPGYERFTTIVIQYHIYSGTQKANHPSPGVAFQGTRRVAYLPASEEGFAVCRMLWVAFQLRMTFTVGTSITTGRDNMVVWNDIHHRTRVDGGPSNFGYPDPDYLGRVTGELAWKGITEEFIEGFNIPF